MDTHDAPDAVRKAAEAEIQAAVAEYDAAPAVALARRDERIRKAAKVAGLKQIEVIKLTGYSRETVRQALNPEARAAVRQAAEERRAQQLHHRDGDPRNNDPGNLELRDGPEA
jgi:phosphoheptose isomerase